jgi:hypothetical protein
MKTASLVRCGPASVNNTANHSFSPEIHADAKIQGSSADSRCGCA